MAQALMRTEQVPSAASDIETQEEAMSSPSVKVRRLGLALGSVLLIGVLAAATTLIRHPLQGEAGLSPIVSEDAAGGICFMTMFEACGCANCDAHVNTEDGAEKCFSTVGVTGTDDDNGACHEYSTKCTLEVGQKYEVKCTGDWDSGAWLQIGNSKFCDGKEETKEFTAEAAEVTPAREQYEEMVEDEEIKDVLNKYGWSRPLLDCMTADLGDFAEEFDKDKVNAVEWDDLEPQLRAKISQTPTCENPQQEDGIIILKMCMEKAVSDANTDQEEDDDW